MLCGVVYLASFYIYSRLLSIPLLVEFGPKYACTVNSLKCQIWAWVITKKYQSEVLIHATSCQSNGMIHVTFKSGCRSCTSYHPKSLHIAPLWLSLSAE